MSRRSILNVIEDIKKVLLNGEEMSVKKISERVKSQWETAIKALEFMKKQGIVKERQGKKTNKTERLFSLKSFFTSFRSSNILSHLLDNNRLNS